MLTTIYSCLIAQRWGSNTNRLYFTLMINFTIDSKIFCINLDREGAASSNQENWAETRHYKCKMRKGGGASRGSVNIGEFKTLCNCQSFQIHMSTILIWGLERQWYASVQIWRSNAKNNNNKKSMKVGRSAFARIIHSAESTDHLGELLFLPLALGPGCIPRLHNLLLF